MIPSVVGIPAVIILCLLLQGCDGGEDDKCPPWHFTPANATTPCSECSFPATDDFYCNDTGLIIDTNFIVTATDGSYPLVIGKGVFGRYKPEHLYCKSVMFTKLPSNMSEFENFFCSAFKRQGFLCGQCKPGCGIAIYTYYGLVCECPCYSYGIPLYILLEIGFSTLFFAVLAVCSFSVNSSKWITVILYYQVIANAVSSDSTTYTVLAKSSDWVPIVLQSLYGIWNMDFLRLVIPRFCVSQEVSVLGAISTGYISAFWPLVLVVLTSLAMHLHKRNFKEFHKLDVSWFHSATISWDKPHPHICHIFCSVLLESCLHLNLSTKALSYCRINLERTATETHASAKFRPICCLFKSWPSPLCSLCIHCTGPNWNVVTSCPDTLPHSLWDMAWW